MKMYWAHW